MKPRRSRRARSPVDGQGPGDVEPQRLEVRKGRRSGCESTARKAREFGCASAFANPVRTTDAQPSSPQLRCDPSTPLLKAGPRRMLGHTPCWISHVTVRTARRNCTRESEDVAARLWRASRPTHLTGSRQVGPPPHRRALQKDKFERSPQYERLSRTPGNAPLCTRRSAGPRRRDVVAAASGSDPGRKPCFRPGSQPDARLRQEAPRPTRPPTFAYIEPLRFNPPKPPGRGSPRH